MVPGRETDIRSDVQPLVDYLYQLYETTDPERGPSAEELKFHNAQFAIHIWWRIYGRLMLWAQSQILGYQLLRVSEPLRELLEEKKGGASLDPNSHELELLGLTWAFNPPAGQMAAVESLRREIDSLHLTTFEDAIMRSTLVRLLLSTDANSSFWRFPLSHALRAANAGQTMGFFAASRSGRRGQPYMLDWYRSIAIAHVYFLVGAGRKKHEALIEVSNAINVSAETLRDWEKQLVVDEFFSFDWRSAELAGKLGEAFEGQSVLELEERFGAEFLGPVSDIESARYFLERRNMDWSLESVRENLLLFHDAKFEP